MESTALLINRIPLAQGENSVETLLVFQEISELQKKMHSAQKQFCLNGFVAKSSFGNIIGTGPAIQKAKKIAAKYAKSSVTILLESETGTGKELFAQSIHNASNRKHGPFVAVNCATFSETLLESELFGYEEGAFTGAHKGGKIGLLELAHQGTIFLDEIDAISPSLQSRLLRVLQEKEILRVGGNRIINVDVRFIAATNKKLYNLVKEGKFREDLYFRLNVLNLRLPPLRERIEDIPHLIDFFIHKSKGRSKNVNISSKGIEILQKYDWPGNVRELEKIMKKILVMADTTSIEASFIHELIQENRESRDGKKLPDKDTITIHIGPLKDMEMQIAEKLLQRFDGKKNLVSNMLGISRTTLWNRLRDPNELDAEHPRYANTEKQ